MEMAGTSKTELDTSTQKAGEAKTALDGSAKTAGGGDALRAKKLALIRGDQSWQSYPSAV